MVIMKQLPPKVWVVIRLLVVGCSLDILSYPRDQSNLDWVSCVLISSAFSIVLFGWLALTRFRKDVDWSEAYAWKEPFLPMSKYPLRFWTLVSYSLLVGGGAALLKDAISRNGYEAFGGTFFVLGVAIAIVLRIWMKKVVKKR